MPTLARPSLSNRQRSTPSPCWPRATSRQPVSQPSPRLVEPRGSMAARARRAPSTASGVALRGADDRVDLVVVGDHGKAVIGVEPRERLFDGRLGEGQLGPCHRTRAVDDEGEVDRRARARALDGRRRDRGEDEAVAAIRGADQLPVLADGKGHDGSSSRICRASSTSRSTRLCWMRERGRLT